MPVLAQGLSAGREVEPVVVPGSRLYSWVDVENLTRINLYRYTGNGQFQAIPFQIDKRRKINLKHNKTHPTPAAIPTGLAGAPGDTKADLDWSDNQDTDIYGYNVYMSTTPGGPYNKMNASPIKAWQGPQWTQVGLTNGLTYYFTVTSVDLAGNESGYSAEVSVTPGP